MSTRARWAVASAAMLVRSLAAPALATPSARLVYSRTEDALGCPTESDLHAAVTSRVGYDPFFAWAPRTVIVQLSRPHARYVARVQLVDAQGVAHGARELSSGQPGCAELFDAVALAVSIALAASAPETASETAPAPTPAPAPAPAPAPTPAPAPPSAHLDLDLGADALGSLGRVPALAPGGTLFVRALWGAWSVAIELRADGVESQGRAASLGGGRVEAWLPGAGLVPCLHLGPVAVCAVVEGGSLEASGRDIEPQYARAVPVLMAGGRVAFEWPSRSTFALRAHADLVANLDPAHLVLGEDAVWDAPPLSGTLGAGALVRFR
jgi:hypothetical protein